MKYFKMEEFECRCCGKVRFTENIEALVENVLDPAREKLGMAIAVNSGFRCPKHNAAVGGVPLSQHMVGEAADISPLKSGSKLEQLAAVIVEQGKYDQVILYPTFVHVSWKKNGANRRQILKKSRNGYQRLSKG